MKISTAIFSALLAMSATAAFGDDDGPRRMVDIRDYGAKCNGVYDDTAAFRQAIEKAPVGGTVMVPPGRCVVSDTIVIKPTNAVSIAGAGLASQIYQRAHRTMFDFQGVDALSIRDLYLGSVSTVADTALIKLTNSHHMRIDNVTMLGSYYGLHLKGSLLATIVDLRSGTNFGGFFGAVSTTTWWVYGERFNNVSANANTFVAPVLEGGLNGIWIKDTNGEGSLNITGGTIEGVGTGTSGIALKLENTQLPSSITGLHFEANKGADIVLQGAMNVRISAVLSITLIALNGDTRNVKISDSMAQNIAIDLGDGRYPLGTGAKRVILENITTCFAPGPSVISPTPTPDGDFGQPNGPSSPVIPNTLVPGKFRKDIVYTNIGNLCGGG